MYLWTTLEPSLFAFKCATSDYYTSWKTKTRSFFFLSDVTAPTESFLNSKFYLNTISQQFLLYSPVSPWPREVIFHVSRRGAPLAICVCAGCRYIFAARVLLAPSNTQREHTVLRNVNCSNDFLHNPHASRQDHKTRCYGFHYFARRLKWEINRA